MTAFLILLHVAAQIAVIIRALLRPHREPASRMAWVMVVLLAPVVGIVAYILFGEVDIGRRRTERIRAAIASLPALPDVERASAGNLQPQPSERYDHLWRVGRSISGFEPLGGNSGRLLADSNAAIDALVADIDDARDHVHVIFYIWLPDGNGCKVAAALARAAARGVTCRAMVDDLGSRRMVKSEHWQAMAVAGVKVARALPIGSVFAHPFKGRIDLRNHRKIAVIDNWITYCGSQNCADPEFRVKPRYAPWVDAVMRFEGPIARQNQLLFAGDWLGHVDDDLGAILDEPLEAPEPGFSAQVIGTGPTMRYSAMPEMFEALMYTARETMVITTPYFVPDESLLSALCGAARRGVETLLILPAKNDSWIVAAAARSYYSEMLDAGVRIFEFTGGLLHTKSITLDGAVTLIGSANIDRRSFQLNYENNVLLHDPALTAAMRARQQEYLDRSLPVTAAEVAAWSTRRRLLNNTIAMFGPVL